MLFSSLLGGFKGVYRSLRQGWVVMYLWGLGVPLITPFGPLVI